jgi:hypothetical protein
LITKAEVSDRVSRIAALVADNESAHFEEDLLRRDVLQAIADGAHDAPGLAAEALKSSSLNFGRWYA